MKGLFFYAFSALIMFSCGQNKEPKATHQPETTVSQQAKQTATPDTTAVAESESNVDKNAAAKQANISPYIQAYQILHQALLTQNTTVIDRFIDKNTGLYIIYSEGAMPQIKHVYAIEQFKTGLNKKIESFVFDKSKQEVQEDDLPKIVCEKSSYDKNGVFGAPVNVFSENPVWEYSDLNEKEKQAAQFSAQKIQYTIINTKDYVYCFGQENGQIYLLFLDLRTPCSA